MRHSAIGRPWLLPLIIFGSIVGLYTLTLTQVHTFDAYSYAMAVQNKPWLETFHPHHLAYGPLGEAAYGLARLGGYRGSALLPLQLVNVLAAAGGVALWFTILRRQSGSLTLALLGSGWLASVFAFWYYAIEVEVYTLATFFLIAACGILLRLLAEPTWRAGWIWLGLAHSGAMLFHQTNVLWVSVVVAGWLSARWPPASSLGERLRLALRYGGVSALIIGGTYGAVMFGWSGFRSLGEMQRWLFEYATTGFWGGPVSAYTLVRLGRGWKFTLSEVGGQWGWLLIGSLIILRLPQLIRTHRPTLVVMGIWLLVYALFFGWWEADNIEFWIATLPPVSLLATLALSTLSGRWRTAAMGVAGALTLLLLVANARAIELRGDPARDTDRQSAAALAAAGAPEDFYLVPNGMQELYLRYEYARPNVQALSVGNGDWAEGCALLQHAITSTTSAGYRVWIDPGALDPPAELLTRYQLDAAAVRSCFAPFADLPTTVINGTAYRTMQPVPNATPTWEWRTWTLGWRPNSISNSTFAGGWRFVPGDDPHLISPRLSLEAGDWRAVEITMATTIPNQHGQIYWIAPGTQAEEPRSVTWDIIADGQPHTYTIDLSERSTWQGPIGLLRIDPVAQGDGVSHTTLLVFQLIK